MDERGLKDEGTGILGRSAGHFLAAGTLWQGGLQTFACAPRASRSVAP